MKTSVSPKLKKLHHIQSYNPFPFHRHANHHLWIFPLLVNESIQCIVHVLLRAFYLKPYVLVSNKILDLRKHKLVKFHQLFPTSISLYHHNYIHATEEFYPYHQLCLLQMLFHIFSFHQELLLYLKLTLSFFLLSYEMGNHGDS